METTQVTNKKKFYKRWWFWALVVFVFFIIIGSSGKENPPQQNTPVAQTADYVMNIGDQGYLRNGQNEVLVPASKNALDLFTKSAIAHDDIGMTQIVTSGQAYFVKAGTKVLIIDRPSLGVKEIRILDGESAGKTGFVPMEFVKKE